MFISRDKVEQVLLNVKLSYSFISNNILYIVIIFQIILSMGIIGDDQCLVGFVFVTKH
ncbi:Uncharacterised protein [Escherichia coli]|nr:hypothetical protein SAMN05216485_1002209 [Shigella sonnei]SQL87821.1 Uncharacterised protein [Escherichia coli]SQL92287.1 Uncharacterised protein [Escherichia coli]SQO17232.1 Uncharacterised protein [Escherichia coli]SQP42115.1 Uncharacterised protein [Escherichia coli]